MQIVPLAYAIVDSDNDESWFLFFRNLKAAFGEHDELVIVSDGHKSIGKSVNFVYDSVEHGFCVFHLYKNLKKNHNSSPI